jgi:hypothetical protein
MSAKGSLAPRLTGHHSQPFGGKLRMPKVGDAIIITEYEGRRGHRIWAYMDHYIDMVKHGLEIAAAEK